VLVEEFMVLDVPDVPIVFRVLVAELIVPDVPEVPEVLDVPVVPWFTVPEELDVSILFEP